MIKKAFVFAAFMIAGAAAVFAWPINIPHRVFEMGFDVQAGFSNNSLKAKDFLKKDLVIDPDAIDAGVPDKGFQGNMYGYLNLFMNLNLSNGVHVGTESGIDSYGYLNISKDLFDFLADGLNVNQSIEVEGDMKADAFFFSDVAVGFDIDDWHLEFVPALVMPLLHAETSKTEGSFVNKSDGSIVSGINLHMQMYSCTSLEPMFDGNFSITDLVKDMKNGWGFDLGFTIERPICDMLQGMVYTRIPIVPGTLNYSTEMNSSMTYECEGIKSIFSSGTSSPEWNNSDRVYSEEKYYLSRPFRLGAKVAWRPFGKWNSFDGLLGFGVKYPWTSNAKFYGEYDFSAYFSVAHVIGIKLATGYSDDVFKHSVGILFNVRVFELNAGISVQGGDFINCFKGSGVGAYMGMRFGF